MSKLRYLERGLLVCAVAMSMLVGSAAAQSTISIENGITPPAVAAATPGNSYALSNLERYSPYNGRLSLVVPLHHVGGRGEVGYDMLAVIDTHWDVPKHFNADGTVGSIVPTIVYSPALELMPVSISNPDVFVMGGACPDAKGDPSVLATEPRFEVIWNDHSTVGLRDTGKDGQPIPSPYQCSIYNYPAAPAQYDAGRGSILRGRDGSELELQLDSNLLDSTTPGGGNCCRVFSGVLRTPGGMQYRFDSDRLSWLKDRNGNEISFARNPNYPAGDPRSFAAAIDPLGRQTSYLLGATDGDCSAASPCDRIRYAGAGGQPRSIDVHYASLDSVLRSGFAISSYHQLFPDDPYLVNTASQMFIPAGLISSITLPDGSSYQFEYDSYAELARVKLPTGGAVEYDYGSGDAASPEGIVGNLNDTYPLILYRRVTQRRTYNANGSLEGTTNYTSAAEGSGGLVVTESTTEASGAIVQARRTHYVSDPRNERMLTSTTYPYWMWGRVTEVEEGSPVLKTTRSIWAQRAAVSWCAQSNSCFPGEPENDPRLTETDVLLNDTNQQSKTTFGYDDSNNVIGETIFDFGAGSPGNILKQTATTYKTDASYLNINLVSLPAEVKVFDGSGRLNADTQYRYDEGSLANCPNIAGHDNQNYAGSAARGNVTSVARCLNTSSCSWLTTAMGYDIAGNVVGATDANNHRTASSYEDAYAVGNDRNTYAFATSTSNALGQTTSAFYDYGSGKLVEQVDLNRVAVLYSYGDALDRLTQVRRAAGGGAAVESQTNYSYPDANTLVEAQDQNSTGDGVIRSQTRYDGFGRERERDVFEGASQYIATMQSYDSLGRVAATTNPSRTANGGSDGLGYTTAYGYDALGRVTRVTGRMERALRRRITE